MSQSPLLHGSCLISVVTIYVCSGMTKVLFALQQPTKVFVCANFIITQNHIKYNHDMDRDDILQSHWGCLQKHSTLFKARVFSENEEPFSHKIISLWRCLFLRYIPKRYYKHISPLDLQLQRQNTKNPFDIFMFISFVTGEVGGKQGSQNSARNHQVFSLMAYRRFSSAVLASYQFPLLPYAVPANYLQVKRKIHSSSLQAPPNLKVEHFGTTSVPFWLSCSL